MGFARGAWGRARGVARVRGDVRAVIQQLLDLFSSFLFAEPESAHRLLKFSYEKRQYISSRLHYVRYKTFVTLI